PGALLRIPELGGVDGAAPTVVGKARAPGHDHLPVGEHGAVRPLAGILHRVRLGHDRLGTVDVDDRGKRAALGRMPIVVAVAAYLEDAAGSEHHRSARRSDVGPGRVVDAGLEVACYRHRAVARRVETPHLLGRDPEDVAVRRDPRAWVPLAMMVGTKCLSTVRPEKTAEPGLLLVDFRGHRYGAGCNGCGGILIGAQGSVGSGTTHHEEASVSE